LRDSEAGAVGLKTVAAWVTPPGVGVTVASDNVSRGFSVPKARNFTSDATGRYIVALALKYHKFLILQMECALCHDPLGQVSVRVPQKRNPQVHARQP
jgi:hypothetical protein